MTPGETYQDPIELTRDRAVDFDNPLECAAIAAARMLFATPEEVAGMLTSPSGQAELAYTWARMDPPDRHLWRRRAAVIVDAHGVDAHGVRHRTRASTRSQIPAEALGEPDGEPDPVKPE